MLSVDTLLKDLSTIISPSIDAEEFAMVAVTEIERLLADGDDPEVLLAVDIPYAVNALVRQWESRLLTPKPTTARRYVDELRCPVCSHMFGKRVSDGEFVCSKCRSDKKRVYVVVDGVFVESRKLERQEKATLLVAKPYSGASDPRLPDYVQGLPSDARQQWVTAFNDVYARCQADGGEDCDERAFRAANAAGKSAEEEYKHRPGGRDHNQQAHAGFGAADPTGATGFWVSDVEYKKVAAMAAAKVRAAPVPSKADVEKARADLWGGGRAGGEARGGSAGDRRRQRETLFREFGGKEKGYAACHCCGLKMHHTSDRVQNPNNYPLFERGKIFTKYQGGGYKLPNLIPECFTANRSRGDKPVRFENLELE